MSLDFSKMRFDVSKVKPKMLMVDAYPELNEYKEFKDGLDDPLLRISCLMMEEQSPFLQIYRDNFELRLTKVFEYLKVDNALLYRDINNGNNIRFNAIITRLFAIMDNLAYVVWQSKLMNFHYVSKFLREPPDMNNIEASIAKKLAVDAQLPTIHKGLVEYEQQIFPDSSTRKIIREQMAKILQFPEKMSVDKSVV